MIFGWRKLINSSDIELFEKYSNAGAYAFGSKKNSAVVSDADKDHYWRIYQQLIAACEDALGEHGLSGQLYVEPQRYSRTRGSRGHRPKDLWCAVRNKDSEDFNKMPQIYIIASDRGVELGFAVSIRESDYHDAKIKQQNRVIIPQIHRKLPADGPVVDRLDELVRSSPEWHVNAATRLLEHDDGFDAFDTPSELFRYLKAETVSRGGGAICRIFPVRAFHEGMDIDLKGAFSEALQYFGDIQMSCAPSVPDRKFVIDQTRVIELSEDEEVWLGPEPRKDQVDFNNIDLDKKFREVAVRQGQAKFRSELIDLFDGKCAITGCAVGLALQAAHIVPYRKNNRVDVTNGLLLRADIHTLFDLFLVSVSPEDMRVHVSSQLADTEYMELNGRQIVLNARAIKKPSRLALQWHFEQFVREH